MNADHPFQFTESSNSQSYSKWQLKLRELNVRGLILTTTKSIKYLVKNDSSKTNQLNLTDSEKVENYLGSECDIFTFDTTISFDPNFFGAVTGSLVGGGILILILTESDLDNAIGYSEDLKKKISVVSGKKTLSEVEMCPVLERFLRFSINNASTAIFNNHCFHTNQKLFRNVSSKTPPCKTEFNQQQDLIEKIKRVSNGHANRPLVLTAKRGRGKSAALGIAAAQLAQTKPLTILVTAPKFNNLSSFYKHLEATLKQLNEADLFPINLKQLKKIQLSNGSLIKFVAIDQIIKTSPFANLVIIDEAAAVPVFQLEQITRRYNRIIFSTTTDGYEGNGKGFEIRFKKRLLEIKTNTVFASLTQPIRWSSDDELEQSCFKGLLLESKIETLDESKITANCINQLSFEIISQTMLKKSEIELQLIFSLLVNAHYQTRPTDLKTILTDHKTKVFVVKWLGKIIAVCLVKQEGALDETICQQICQASKRLKGELLPQSVMANFGLKEAGKKVFFRVMRIAVHPQIQNLGIGSYLLDNLTIYAKENKVDLLGSSFSATPEVVKFWLKNDYFCIRFGSSKDSSSGNHCLEVLKPLNDESESMVNFLVGRFNQSFLYKLHGELNDLELSVISLIVLEHLTYQNIMLDEYEIHELQQFTEGKRSFSAIDDLLIKLVQLKRKNINHANGWTDKQIEFLIAAVFKQINMKDLAPLFKLEGKSASLLLLRELTDKLILN